RAEDTATVANKADTIAAPRHRPPNMGLSANSASLSGEIGSRAAATASPTPRSAASSAKRDRPANAAAQNSDMDAAASRSIVVLGFEAPNWTCATAPAIETIC